MVDGFIDSHDLRQCAGGLSVNEDKTMNEHDKYIEISVMSLEQALDFAKKYGRGKTKIIRIVEHELDLAPEPLLCAISGDNLLDITDTEAW